MKRKANHPNLPRQILRATIISLSHDGRGIATLPDGKTTFISGALPGETVSFKITKKHTRYNEGEVVEIITASSERTTPECKHFGTCGGCSMQHITMTAQIQFKQKALLEQLKHFGQIEPEVVLPPLSGKTWEYRRKARLSVYYAQNKNETHVGFREKSSQTLVPIETCPILHGSIGQRLPALRDLVANLSQCKHIPQIEVAVSEHVTALVFRHTKPFTEIDITKLITFGTTHQIHIYLQPNSPEPIHKLWPADQQNNLLYSLPDDELEMHFHPTDFTQINAEVNLLMVKHALQLIDPQPHENILDLFCGLGNFTLPMARHANHVVGIEGSQEMVARAEQNAQSNKINNVGFYAANLAVTPSMRQTWMKQKYDKILLDPPRTGAKEIIAFFPQFAAKRIVYVSCNPATLARDAGELVHQQGYKLKKVGVINMFPHTSHIEAIALFQK